MPPLAKHVFLCMENIFLNDRMILLNMHTHMTLIISNTMVVLCRLYILKYFHCAWRSRDFANKTEAMAVFFFFNTIY